MMSELEMGVVNKSHHIDVRLSWSLNQSVLVVGVGGGGGGGGGGVYSIENVLYMVAVLQ